MNASEGRVIVNAAWLALLSVVPHDDLARALWRRVERQNGGLSGIGLAAARRRHRALTEGELRAELRKPWREPGHRMVGR